MCVKNYWLEYVSPKFEFDEPVSKNNVFFFHQGNNVNISLKAVNKDVCCLLNGQDLGIEKPSPQISEPIETNCQNEACAKGQ